MKTKIFHTRIWDDTYFTELGITEKLLFIYYVFNEKNNQLFCYECPEKSTASDTGINTGIIRGIKRKFQKDGKIAFYKGWVYLVNANKYETYRGDKNDIAKDRLRATMASDVLDWYNNLLDRGIDRGTLDTLQNTEIRDIDKEIDRVVKGKKEILDDLLFVEEMQSKFPGVDVISEIEKMKDWLSSSGKVKKDYAAFARNWLRSAKPTKETNGIVVIRA